MKLKAAYKAIITAAILLPALIVGAFGSYCYFGFYTHMVSEETAPVIYSEVKAQALFFERYSARLSSMAQLEQISHAAGGDYTAIKDQVNEVINSFTDPALLDVIIIDSSGRVVTNLREELNLHIKLFEGYDDPLTETDNDSVYVSPVFVGNQNYGTDVIYIAKPVLTPAGFTGYIAAAVDAEWLSKELAGAVFFNGAGSIMFVDSAGVVLGADVSSAIQFTPNMLSAINETNRYVAFNEKGYYGAYGVIDNTDWTWIGICRSSGMTFSVVPAILFGLVTLAAVMVIDLLLAILVYRRTITPLGQIAQTLDQINAGDRKKRLPGFKVYEYQVISEAVNDMLENFYLSDDVHRAVSSLSDSMLFEWDFDQETMYLSDSFKHMFDINAEKAGLLNGTFIDTLMSDRDAKRFRRDMASLAQEREYLEGEYKVRTLRNTEIWINIQAHSYKSRSDNNGIVRILGVVTDINNRKKSSLQFSQKVSFDFLSQLYSRNTFLNELQKLLDMKRVNESYAVLFVDLDDFRFINDRYGHNVGDEVIRYASDTLKRCIGKGGIAGRFGSNDFVLCVTDREKVARCADFVTYIIDELYSGFRCESAGITLNVKASIGISVVSEQVSDAEKPVGEADEAMYFVKKNGKANFHFYDPSTAYTLDLSNAIT